MTEETRQIAVVTGVTSGIGEAVASALIASGAVVYGVGRSAEKLTETRRALGESLVPVVADLSSRAARRAAIDSLAETLPHVSVLVCNAALCAYATPTEIDGDAFAELFEVNLLASADLVRGLAPRFVDGSHVVFLSSVTARHLPHARFAPYAMTKTAIEGLAEALRLELWPKGVRVSTIAPGLVDTPIYDKVSGFEQTAKALRKHVPEWLRPSDVAESLMWMVGRPANVLVSEMTLLPRGQAR